MIKKGARVKILAGKDKNKEGEVILDHKGNAVKEKILIINPKSKNGNLYDKFNKDYILQDEDIVYLIAYTRPNLETIV